MLQIFLSDEQRQRITTMKHLCCDDSGIRWQAMSGFNCYLCNLKWNQLDSEIHKDVLLYQIEPNGELHILALVFLVSIKTGSAGYDLVYKTDVRHARLETFFIPRWHLDRVGVMTIRAVDDEFSLQPPLSQTDV